MSWNQRLEKFFEDHPEIKDLAPCNSPYASQAERHRGDRYETALNTYPEYRALMEMLNQRLEKFFEDHPETKDLAPCNSPYASRAERHRGHHYETALNTYPEYRALMEMKYASSNPAKR